MVGNIHLLFVGALCAAPGHCFLATAREAAPEPEAQPGGPPGPAAEGVFPWTEVEFSVTRLSGGVLTSIRRPRSKVLGAKKVSSSLYSLISTL